jgi:hypothetical protein
MALSLDVKKWSDNTSELQRNLAAGLQQINATKDSVDKLANSLAGEAQIRAADRWQQALQKLGGEAGALGAVERLTSAEIDRGTAVIDKAIAKYEALGATAPKAFTDLQAALQAVSGGLQRVCETSDAAGGKVSGLGRFSEELKPQTDNAAAAFSSFKTTLTEAFDRPWRPSRSSLARWLVTSRPASAGSGCWPAGPQPGSVAVGAASFELAERAAAVGGAPTSHDLGWADGRHFKGFSTSEAALRTEPFRALRSCTRGSGSRHNSQDRSSYPRRKAAGDRE